MCFTPCDSLGLARFKTKGRGQTLVDSLEEQLQCDAMLDELKFNLVEAQLRQWANLKWADLKCTEENFVVNDWVLLKLQQPTILGQKEFLENIPTFLWALQRHIKGWQGSIQELELYVQIEVSVSCIPTQAHQKAFPPHPSATHP